MPRRKTVRRTGPPTCNDCGALIVFVRMVATDKQLPVDPIPVADGNVCARLIGNRLHGYVITEDRPPNPGMQRYAAHFGTCTDRQDRRKPKPTPAPPATLFDLPKE
ncbi:hypothetical protein ACXJJ3_26740 [Kribbella sp. WER1]